jgi:multiple sugar transport system substrate-binding protein
MKLLWPWRRWPLADRKLPRLIAFFSLILIGTTLCFAAVVPSGAAADPTTLSFMIGAQELPTWQPVIAAFERDNPDIKLKIIEGPSSPNLVEDLYTSAFLLGDSPYDLVFMDIVWVPKFAAAGWLLDLSNRLTATDKADFLATDLAGGTYQSKLYRIPARTDAGLLYYRQDLLDQAGLKPPNTITELLTAARTIQSQGKARWGYLWQGKQYEGLPAMFVEILAGYGGFWIDPQNLAVGLDRPEAIAAVNFLLETLKTGVTPPGVTTYQEEETRRIFQAGDAVFLRNWPYTWPLANKDDSRVKGKIGLKPMIYRPGARSAACQGGWGWGIARSTAHPDAAWRAVQYLSNAASQKKIVLSDGYLPTRRSLYQDADVLKKYPYFPTMLEVLNAAVLRPPIAQYAQASDILQRYLSAIFTQQMSPETAMQAAAQETRQLLKQG